MAYRGVFMSQMKALSQEITMLSLLGPKKGKKTSWLIEGSVRSGKESPTASRIPGKLHTNNEGHKSSDKKVISLKGLKRDRYCGL